MLSSLVLCKLDLRLNLPAGCGAEPKALHAGRLRVCGLLPERERRHPRQSLERGLGGGWHLLSHQDAPGRPPHAPREALALCVLTHSRLLGKGGCSLPLGHKKWPACACSSISCAWSLPAAQEAPVPHSFSQSCLVGWGRCRAALAQAAAGLRRLVMLRVLAERLPSGPGVMLCENSACTQEACGLDAAGTLLASAQGQPLSLGTGSTVLHQTSIDQDTDRIAREFTGVML